MTAGARYEGRSTLIDRYGLTTQLWLAKPFLHDRIALGVGFGPYFAIDQRRGGHEQGRNSDAFIAEIASITGSFGSASTGISEPCLTGSSRATTGIPTFSWGASATGFRAGSLFPGSTVSPMRVWSRFRFTKQHLRRYAAPGRKGKQMRKTFLALWVFLFITAMVLSGCIWWVDRDDEGRRGYRGEPRRDHNDDRRPRDYDERR